MRPITQLIRRLHSALYVSSFPPLPSPSLPEERQLNKPRTSPGAVEVATSSDARLPFCIYAEERYTLHVCTPSERVRGGMGAEGGYRARDIHQVYTKDIPNCCLRATIYYVSCRGVPGFSPRPARARPDRVLLLPPPPPPLPLEIDRGATEGKRASGERSHRPRCRRGHSWS